MDSMETKKKLTTILIHVILIIVSITMLVPFIWMILTAFKTVTEATSVDPFSRKYGEKTHLFLLSIT